MRPQKLYPSLFHPHTDCSLMNAHKILPVNIFFIHYLRSTCESTAAVIIDTDEDTLQACLKMWNEKLYFFLPAPIGNKITSHQPKKPRHGSVSEERKEGEGGGDEHNGEEAYELYCTM
jgi:hypothetical protein